MTCSYAFLHFDEAGHIDLERFNRDQVARIDAHLGHALTSRSGAKVVDVSSHFAARSGQWQPSPDSMAKLKAAALGWTRCPRIKPVPALTAQAPHGKSYSMDEFPQPPANFAILRDAEGREAVRFVGPSGVVPVVATEIPMGAVNLLVRKLKRKLRDGERRRARRVLAGGK